MLITFERRVPHRSDASQNDHKSSGSVELDWIGYLRPDWELDHLTVFEYVKATNIPKHDFFTHKCLKVKFSIPLTNGLKCSYVFANSPLFVFLKLTRAEKLGFVSVIRKRIQLLTNL